MIVLFGSLKNSISSGGQRCRFFLGTSSWFFCLALNILCQNFDNDDPNMKHYGTKHAPRLPPRNAFPLWNSIIYPPNSLHMILELKGTKFTGTGAKSTTQPCRFLGPENCNRTHKQKTVNFDQIRTRPEKMKESSLNNLTRG